MINQTEKKVQKRDSSNWKFLFIIKLAYEISGKRMNEVNKVKKLFQK